ADGDRCRHPRSHARHRETARRRASVAIDRARLATRLPAREGFPSARRCAGGGTVMARRIGAIALALTLAGCAATPAPIKAPAPPSNPAVGGVAMIASWTAIDNARAAPPLAIFARAIDAAGLADTLAGAGPFTVFAPTDA